MLSTTGTAFATRHPNVLEPTVVAGIERFTNAGLVIRSTTKVRLGSHGQVARDLREEILTAFVESGLKTPIATAA